MTSSIKPTIGSGIATHVTGYGALAKSAQARPVADHTETRPVRPEYREPDRIEQMAGQGPRVTPDDIEANIAQEFYFRGDEGVFGANNIASRDNEHQPALLNDAPLSLMTFCILVLRNGYTVTGASYVGSPENFNAELGRKFAREDAVRQVWPLLGFRLADEIARQKWAAANPAMPAVAC